MKLSMTRGLPVAAVALAGSLALAACGASNETAAGGSGSSSSAKQLSGTVNGAGSSAQQAAMQAWAASYTKQQPKVTVNYDPVGSGGGRKQFLSGGADFAGSDAYLTDDEVTQAKSRCTNGEVFEIPDYVSPIAVVYNLPSVKKLQLSPATLAKIFAGQITTWDDAAVKADNPGATLPSTKITPVHRSDDSGTTKNFTDYLHATAPDAWTNAPAGTWPIQGGEAGAQTSGLISSVKAGEGTIGYADDSQAGDLGKASIKVGDSYTAPSADGAAKVVASSQQVQGRGQYDLALTVNRTATGAGDYPVLLVSYLMGCTSYDKPGTGEVVKDFMGYVISKDGQQAAAQQAGSAPMSDQLRQKAQQVVDAIKA